MIKPKVLAGIVALTGFLVLSSGCNLFLPEEDAFVSIDAPDPSRALRLPPLLEQPELDFKITAYEVEVTGPNMKPVLEKFPPITRVLRITVPSGENRRFRVTARVDPRSPTAALAYEGVTFRDLKPQEQATIVVTMQLSETELVVPDSLNGRLVRLYDMQGDGFEVYQLFSGDPFDVDFDSRGRIYFSWDGEGSGISRIDHFDQQMEPGSEEQILLDSAGRILALAIDRPRNLLYYTVFGDGDKGDPLYVMDLGEPEPREKLLGEIPDMLVHGMDVDAQGLLYLAGLTNDGLNDVGRIMIYDPVGGRVLLKEAPFKFVPQEVAADILVKDELIYTLHAPFEGSTKVDPKVVAFKYAASRRGIEMGVAGVITGEKLVRGPFRFVGRLNPFVTYTDEDPSGETDELDRLVSIDDIRVREAQFFPPRPTAELFRLFVGGRQIRQLP